MRSTLLSHLFSTRLRTGFITESSEIEDVEVEPEDWEDG